MRISYFAGSTVIITGASAGIGCEFARQLAPVASKMILLARRNDRLEALESELKATNPGLELFNRPLDLRDQAKLERFCDWLDESGLRIDLLINNAGMGDHGSFVESDWERVRLHAAGQRERSDLPHLQSPARNEKCWGRCDSECEFRRRPASFA